MSLLLVMRHGRAEAAAASDAARRLTAPGREELRASAQALAQLGLQVEVILTSPYVRTQETAALMALGLGVQMPIPVEELAAGGDPRVQLEAIERVAASQVCLAVGHAPDVSQLVTLATTRSTDEAVAFEPGAVACIMFQGGCAPGRGVLRWHMQPEQLALVARAQRP